jgi:hypothetical protein
MALSYFWYSKLLSTIIHSDESEDMWHKIDMKLNDKLLRIMGLNIVADYPQRVTQVAITVTGNALTQLSACQLSLYYSHWKLPPKTLLWANNTTSKTKYILDLIILMGQVRKYCIATIRIAPIHRSLWSKRRRSIPSSVVLAVKMA